MMNTFRHRLGLLVAAIMLVAGLTMWGMQYSWRQINGLERKLSLVERESFRLAGEFQRKLLNLNHGVLRYTAREQDFTWEEFERDARELNHWIDNHDPRYNQAPDVATEEERELFKRINDAYDTFLTAARQVRSNAEPAVASAPGLSQLGNFEQQSARLLQLSLQLANAHRSAAQTFVDEANRTLAGLRALQFGGVSLLLCLVAGLAAVIYHDQIAPLRTRLVRSQVLLEKQEKLATLGTLAAGIAHEIRNPLTSVKARLYTLDKHLASPSLARKDAEIISAEITRLERIVQDVLNFARPSEPVLTSLNTQALLGEVRSLMGPGLDSQRITLTVAPGPELWVQADASHLKQVLINLVRNAAEAIDGKGTVTLRARLGRALLAGRDTDAVVLEVADTGRGIPSDVEKRLFDPFFSTKETGTGLGLSIAARIVEKHGGQLQYQTRVGHGTTFGIVLPRAVADTAPGTAA